MYKSQKKQVKFEGIKLQIFSFKSERKVKFTQSCPTLCDPHGLYSPWNSPGQITGVGSLSLTSPGDLPNPGIEPRSPSLQADSLPAEPQGKPRDTGVGSLSLLQRIFQSQELNWGFLHCRQIFFLPTELSVKPQFLSYTHPTFHSVLWCSDNRTRNHLKSVNYCTWLSRASFCLVPG